VSRCRQQGCEQSFPMNSKDEDADIARILEMTEVELRAHIAAHGRDADAAAAKLTDAPIEQMEKALFGASLDDIMSLSEFTDLEIRPVGLVPNLWVRHDYAVITQRSMATRHQRAKRQSPAA
jgi:hypothetical protein